MKTEISTSNKQITMNDQINNQKNSCSKDINKKIVKNMESTDSGRESLNNDSDSNEEHHNSKQPLLSLPNDAMKYSDCENSDCEAQNENVIMEIDGDSVDTSNASDSKHYLGSSWTMYYRANKKNDTAHEHNLNSLETQKLAKFDTIEDFWSVTNHMKLPLNIQKRVGPNVMCFRDDIFPEWEDPENLGGGSWGLILTNKYHRGMLNELWLETLMACIGEILDHSEYITGIVLQRRQREDRIQLWTKNANEEQIQMTIGQHFKKILNLANLSHGFEEIKICYTRHNDMEVISSAHRPGQGRWASKGKKRGEEATASKDSSLEMNRRKDRPEDTESLSRGSSVNRASEPVQLQHQSNSNGSYSIRNSNTRAPRRGFHGSSHKSSNSGHVHSNNRDNSNNTSYGFMLEKLERLKV